MKKSHLFAGFGLISTSGALLLTGATAWACVTQGKPDAKASAQLKAKFSKRMPANNEAIPYGGKIEKDWKVEAVLANLFERELKEAGKRPGVVESVVSVPVELVNSDYRPFGNSDKQTNARAIFGDWKEKQPPLFVRRDRLSSGALEYKIVFHSSLGIKEWDATDSGEIRYIQPKGWSDRFAVSFETGMLSAEKMLQHMPDSAKKWPAGKSLPDPEKVASKARAQKTTAYQVLDSNQLGPAYNSKAYPSDRVHGIFPDEKGMRTAVGGVETWLTEPPTEGSPFKHLYVCFAPRDVSEEAQFGVPSGAGWHRVGDPAETVLNSLEKVEILSALGVLIPESKQPYKLNGSANARYLKPGEAWVTKEGQFHWYAINGSSPTCGEIWVHKCVPGPSNSWGFAC